MEKTLLWAEQHPEGTTHQLLRRLARRNGLYGRLKHTDCGAEQSRKLAVDAHDYRVESKRIRNGYVLFGDDNAIPAPDHLHNWYDFWDAELGQPIQEKAVQHQGVAGLFLREF